MNGGAILLESVIVVQVQVQAQVVLRYISASIQGQIGALLDGIIIHWG